MSANFPSLDHFETILIALGIGAFTVHPYLVGHQSAILFLEFLYEIRDLSKLCFVHLSTMLGTRLYSRVPRFPKIPLINREDDHPPGRNWPNRG
jgi:hypothetical protein